MDSAEEVIRANINESTWTALRAAWSLEGDLSGEAAKSLVRALFQLTLALAHAPQFQADHQDSLAQDWIHLPVPKDRVTFLEIARLGEMVTTLLEPLADPTRLLRDLLGTGRRHLGVVGKRGGAAVREDDLAVTISFHGAAQGGWRERAWKEAEPAHPAWGEVTGDLSLNADVFLANVPERVWRYELGGYPVLKKWLGYRGTGRRLGRPLTLAELDHLRTMIHRIAALLILHEQLDRAYERALADPFTAEELGVR